MCFEHLFGTHVWGNAMTVDAQGLVWLSSELVAAAVLLGGILLVLLAEGVPSGVQAALAGCGRRGAGRSGAHPVSCPPARGSSSLRRPRARVRPHRGGLPHRRPLDRRPLPAGSAAAGRVYHAAY